MKKVFFVLSVLLSATSVTAATNCYNDQDCLSNEYCNVNGDCKIFDDEENPYQCKYDYDCWPATCSTSKECIDNDGNLCRARGASCSFWWQCCTKNCVDNEVILGECR